MPFVLISGVPWADVDLVATLLAQRMIVTEVVSYQHLALALQEQAFIYPRSVVIVSYALCGFAHIASMAIFVGGIAALAPCRRHILTDVAGKALLAATLACLMTGCIAGLFA